MKILHKIVLHPKLENEHRVEVQNWCHDNFTKDSWTMNSNYTEHGCFNITVVGRKNNSAVSAFILSFPDVLVLQEQYDEYAVVDEEAFNRNFEYIKG